MWFGLKPGRDGVPGLGCVTENGPERGMMISVATEVYPAAAWRNHGPFFLASAGVITADMPRPCPKTCPPPRPSSLKRLLGQPWPFPGRPPKHDLSTWTVTDEWPEHIPVTEAEVDVFEAWFADLFDELFGLCR